FDPFESYLHDYKKAPLMDLINAEASAAGASTFTKRWGPLKFDESMSEGLFINEQIYRLSHKRGGWLPPIPKLPKEGFRVGVEEFLEEKRKVTRIVSLWKALREANLTKIRALLEGWPETIWRVTDLKQVFKADAEWLKQQIDRNTAESL